MTIMDCARITAIRLFQDDPKTLREILALHDEYERACGPLRSLVTGCTQGADVDEEVHKYGRWLLRRERKRNAERDQ